MALLSHSLVLLQSAYTVSDMAGMRIKCEAVGQVLGRDKCLVCCCRQKPARLKVPKLTVTQCWLLWKQSVLIVLSMRACAA